MDARPNVLNKILPCTKYLDMKLHAATAASHTGFNIFGHNFVHTASKKTYEFCVIPNNIIAGSDGVFKIRGCNETLNDTGSDKIVRLYGVYVIIKKTSIGVTGVTCDPILTTIANGNARQTFHDIDLFTVPNLQPDDIINCLVYRDPTHTDDTWESGYIVCAGKYLEITVDKIGEP